MAIKNENDSSSTDGTFSTSSKDSTTSFISSVTPPSKSLHSNTSSNISQSSFNTISALSEFHFEQQPTPQDLPNINQNSKTNGSNPPYSSLRFVPHNLSEAAKTSITSNQNLVNNTFSKAQRTKSPQDQGKTSFRVLKFSEMNSTNSTNNDTAFQSNPATRIESNNTSSTTKKFSKSVSNTVTNNSSKPTLKEQSPSDISTPPGKRIACVECRQQKVFFFKKIKLIILIIIK